MFGVCQCVPFLADNIHGRNSVQIPVFFAHVRQSLQPGPSFFRSTQFNFRPTAFCRYNSVRPNFPWVQVSVILRGHPCLQKDGATNHYTGPGTIIKELVVARRVWNNRTSCRKRKIPPFGFGFDFVGVGDGGADFADDDAGRQGGQFGGEDQGGAYRQRGRDHRDYRVAGAADV